MGGSFFIILTSPEFRRKVAGAPPGTLPAVGGVLRSWGHGLGPGPTISRTNPSVPQGYPRTLPPLKS